MCERGRTGQELTLRLLRPAEFEWKDRLESLHLFAAPGSFDTERLALVASSLQAWGTDSPRPRPVAASFADCSLQTEFGLMCSRRERRCSRNTSQGWGKMGVRTGDSPLSVFHGA